MVIRPLFFASVICLALSYYTVALGFVPCAALFIVAAFLLVAKIAADIFTHTFTTWAVCLCAVFFAGLCLGFHVVSLRSVPAMLVDVDSVRTVSCRLISDPVPYGEKLWRADAQLLSVENDCGFRSESRGCITVILPDAFASAGFSGNAPGRFAADRKKQRAIPAGKGCVISAQGSFAKIKDATSYLFFSARTASVVSIPKGASFLRIRARAALSRVLAGWGDAGGLLFALLSGNRGYVPQSFLADMRNAGCSHILALSGMHVSLFFGLLCALLSLTGLKRGIAVPGIAVVFLFVWFAGCSPSLARSAIMIVCGTFCKKIHARLNAFVLLVITFCIHLFLFPSHGTELAFILSYSSLGALLVLEPLLTPLLAAVLPKTIASGLAASMGALLGTACFSVLYFGTIYPAGIIASLVLSVAVTVFMVVGIFSVPLVLLIPQLYRMLKSVMILLYRPFAAGASFFGGLPAIKIEERFAGLVLVVSIAVGLCIAFAGKKLTAHTQLNIGA